jgi:hypothetical protein
LSCHLVLLLLLLLVWMQICGARPAAMHKAHCGRQRQTAASL